MDADVSTGAVVAVHLSAGHTFSKAPVSSVEFLVGVGIAGDAHAGATVKHRSRVARDPSQPNLRQVHLIHEELIDELRGRGFPVEPGSMGENVTTRGVDLLGLPAGTVLELGDAAAIEITGLRNPCTQLDAFAPGLMSAVLDHDAEGNLIRRAGIMAVVSRSGTVRPGDPIVVVLPAGERRPLEPV